MKLRVEMKELEQKRYNWVGGKVKNPFSEENIKIDKPLARSIKKMKEKMQINVSYYREAPGGKKQQASSPPPPSAGAGEEEEQKSPSATAW